MNRQPWGILAVLVASADVALAATPTFDLQAFSRQPVAVDISRFNTRNHLPPGRYRVDIRVNGEHKGRHDVEFLSPGDDLPCRPCVDPAKLRQLGITPPTPAHAVVDAPCADLDGWLPLASSTFDANTLEWSMSIPQPYLTQTPRGYVDPIEWDEGVDAGLLNYTFSSSVVTSGEGGDRAYLGLTGGLNLGRWRLRHQGAQAWHSHTGRQVYQNTATYLQRSIAPWQAQLTLGDAFTRGNVLDSIRVRGVTLATDERMLAPSRQGYAPQVRGVADSNATVNIQQNGYTIYETTIAPGPFLISDLYATAYGGDLTVSITEVDGRRTTFTVPYSVAPQLLRGGASHYSLTLGKVRHYGLAGSRPTVFQGTLQHGLDSALTVYGGGMRAEGYAQGKVGAAIGSEYGAFSLDIGGSRTAMPGRGVVTGRSLGLGYNKNLPASGTYFVLGLYRFSTEGYLSIHDALNLREQRPSANLQGFARQKSRLDLNISQRAGPGTLSLYGSSTQYWGRRHGRQTAFSLSYGSTFKTLGWNLSVQRSRVEDTRHLTEREHSDEIFFGRLGSRGRLDNRYLLTLSMPLGSGQRAANLTSSVAWDRGDARGSQQQLGINGALGEEGEVSYGAIAQRASNARERSDAYTLYGGYRGNAAHVRAGYGQSRGRSQASFSAQGGVIAHAGGVTLSQSLGEASALAHVPGAEGATLVGNRVKVDQRGYAVVPALRAFQQNVVSVDPSGMSMEVALEESALSVVPTPGAVTLLRFPTISGRAVVLKARREAGEPLPFAAQVFDEQGREVGVVGQASKAFVRGIAQQGRLLVKWGETDASGCYIDYRLPAPPKGVQRSADVVSGRCLSLTAGLRAGGR